MPLVREMGSDSQTADRTGKSWSLLVPGCHLPPDAMLSPVLLHVSGFAHTVVVLYDVGLTDILVCSLVQGLSM